MNEVDETLRRALADRYSIEAELGAGGMGIVYRALDLKHRRSVAIKILRPDLGSSIGAERFLREVRIAAGLAHPHIVPLHDSGRAAEVLYYVMPLVEGVSLRERIEADGRLPVREALAIARDVADGLEHAHRSGLVHRDIKPGNIMLSGRHALIVDFGVAWITTATSDMALTSGDTVIGTPTYMSPEQFSGHDETDARSDIYSLGCVLHEMLTGRPPYTGKTPAAVIAGHVRGEAPPITKARPEVPAGVADVVAKMLATDPAARFQSAEETLSALERSMREVAPSRGWRASTGLLGTGIAAAALVGIALSSQRPSPTLTGSGGPESVVVLPFHDAASTEEEQALLVDLAGEVTGQLNQWQSIRAVPQVALSGLAFDIGVTTPTFERIEDGLSMAEASEVQGLVAITARLRGDTAVVTSDQFDVATGRRLGRSVEVRDVESDRFGLAAGLVHAMLGLEGTVEDVEQLRRQSPYPDALAQWSEGTLALEQWRLAEAEAAFRGALASDSAFAMAHHYLALALHWRYSRDRSAHATFGPEIGQEALAALRHAEGLAARDSAHIEAFYRFQAGDYEVARDGYRSLIEQDPTDVYAHLLLGSVEYLDPWLAEGADGTLAPRRDLNRALRSFSEAVRLSPGFHIGYGHLFDITEDVLGAIDAGRGQGFETPRSELISPWEILPPHDQVAFFPAALDSLRWLPRAEWRASDGSAERRGAEALLASSMRTLARWASFAPDEPRPLEELANWTLRERSRLTVPAAPQVMDSLSRAALDHASRALSLKADSTPDELLRIANLHLAIGDPAEAEALVERAEVLRLGGRGGGFARAGASNVFLYRGKPLRVFELIDVERPGRRFYEREGAGSLVDDNGAQPVIERLKALASTGVSGPALDSRFQDVDELWSQPGYGADERTLLRRRTAGPLSMALAMSPESVEEWLAGITMEDPVWGLIRGDVTTDRMADHLRSVEGFASPEVPTSVRAFLLGVHAQRLGDHDAATRHFSRLDSLPLQLGNRDPGWGLLSRSYFLRGISLEALENDQLAEDFYARFRLAWTDPDSLAPPLATEAARSLDRLRSESTGPDPGPVVEALLDSPRRR